MRRTCPMAGRRAPELAVGELSTYLEALCEVKSTDFMRSSGQVWGIGIADLARLEASLQASRACMCLTLSAKLCFWGQLPWALAGIAHHRETTARQAALRVCDMFDADPRREAHHRFTWAFMKPGGQLRAALDSFVAGTPRRQLPDVVRQAIAQLAFMPVVETTIEGNMQKWLWRVDADSALSGCRSQTD